MEINSNQTIVICYAPTTNLSTTIQFLILKDEAFPKQLILIPTFQ